MSLFGGAQSFNCNPNSNEITHEYGHNLLEYK